MNYIENKTFEEFKISDSASLQRLVTISDIELFAVMSGDVNPAHVDAQFAKDAMFHKIVAHGMWAVSCHLKSTDCKMHQSFFATEPFITLEHVMIQ